MSSSSIRNILLATFFLIAITPTFSMIEFRDTTQLPQCDTIIDKKGVVSVVHISDLTKTIIKYTLCDDPSKKVYYKYVSKIQDIKSQKFSLAIRGPISQPIPISQSTPSSLTQCDTIIDKKGVVSLVEIIDLTKTTIKYTLCNESEKKIIKRSIDEIQDIKSQKFSFAEPPSLLEQANTAFKFYGIGAAAFLLAFLSIALIFSGLSIPFFILLAISLICILGGFFTSCSVLYRAKKQGDKKAQRKARAGVAIILVPIFLLLVIRMLRF